MGLIAGGHPHCLRLDIFRLQAGKKTLPVCFKACQRVADLGPEVARQP